MMFSTAFGVTYHTVNYIGGGFRKYGNYDLGNVTTTDFINITVNYTNMSN